MVKFIWFLIFLVFYLATGFAMQYFGVEKYSFYMAAGGFWGGVYGIGICALDD